MAVNIPVRRERLLRPVHGTNKSGGGRSGTPKPRQQQPKDRVQAAQQATRENQMMLVLEGGKRRRWVRAADWEN